MGINSAFLTPGEETAWFENPKGADVPWKRHVVFKETDNEYGFPIDEDYNTSPTRKENFHVFGHAHFTHRTR